MRKMALVDKNIIIAKKHYVASRLTESCLHGVDLGIRTDLVLRRDRAHAFRTKPTLNAAAHTLSFLSAIDADDNFIVGIGQLQQRRESFISICQRACCIHSARGHNYRYRLVHRLGSADASSARLKQSATRSP